MTFTACEKEKIYVPTQEDAYWYLHIEGEPSDPFHIVYSINTPPYTTVDYSNILCCNISPIRVKMELGKAYVVSYMGRDSIMHSIFHAPRKIENIHDTIPATMW